MMDDSVTLTLVPGGHAFYAHRGDNDRLYLETFGDEHSGPMCARCSDSRCDACDKQAQRPDIRTEQCRVALEPALPGLSLEEIP